VFKEHKLRRREGVALATPAPVSQPRVPFAGTPAPPPPRTVQPVSYPVLPADDAGNPVRRIGFYVLWVFIFLRFSMLHEVLAGLFGINYVAAAIGIPCVLLMIASGGIQRTLQYRSSKFWTAFMFWLIISIPFSEWKGGSFHAVLGYGRTCFILLFLIVGLTVTWKECRLLMYAVAFGGAANVLVGRILAKETYGRLFLTLQGGSITNANDLAAHLLLVLAFLLYVFTSSGKNVVLRLGSLAILFLGFWEIAKSGSRGAVVAVLTATVFALVRARTPARIATLIALPALLAIFIAMLPRETLVRYATLFDDKANLEDTGARDSTNARTYLLKSSLLFSLKNPVFGVGPGEFADYEAHDATEAGRHAAWSVPHNAYAQISSEAGIPALIFLMAGLISAFRMLTKTHKRAKLDPRFRDIESVSYFTQLGMVAFCAASFFLPMAYHFYLPAISGLAIAIAAAAEREFKAAGASAAQFART
jgi:O-antigen ligase